MSIRSWRLHWYWFVASLFVLVMTYVFLDRHNFFLPSHNPEFRLRCVHLRGKPYSLASLDELHGYCPEPRMNTASPRRCSQDHVDAHVAEVYPIPARTGKGIWKCNLNVVNDVIESTSYVFN
jgi:hypothetical protein